MPLLLAAADGRASAVLAQQPDTVSAEAQDTAAVAQDTAAVQIADSAAALEATVDSPRVPTFPAFPQLRPTSPGIRYHWTNADILNTGAITLADLLEIRPNLDPIRVGFLEGPQTSVFAGSGPISLRLSIEGYQAVPLFGGPLDQHQVSLVEQEGAQLIREPGGTQMAVRTYRNLKPTPYSRIEAGTGDRNANLLRGFFSSWLAGTLIGFGFDRVDTSGLAEAGGSERTLVYGSLAHKLVADAWGQLEVRRVSLARDSFPSVARTDWILRVRREFAKGWYADFIGGAALATVEEVIPPGQPDSLFPDLSLDAQQFAVRGAKLAERWEATALVRVWGGSGVPNIETEATAELHAGPAELYASGRYADWDAFNAAAGYASLRFRLPLGLSAIAEIEEGDRGLYNSEPIPRVEFGRWSLGGELQWGSWRLGGYGGRWRVSPSPSLGVPYDTGFALPGGTVGVAELRAEGDLFRLFGGTISAGGRYRAREAGTFAYWPQERWRLEGQYHLTTVGDQLEILLQGKGGIRGAMRIPDDTDGPDPVRFSQDLSWFWGQIIVRIRDARLFLTYEIFDSPDGTADVPRFGLPLARTHFGLKWEFWN